MLRPFHLAVPVISLQDVRHFYGEILGCSFGRSTDIWIDINFFGHQLVFHQAPLVFSSPKQTSKVDHKDVPVPHFGIILSPEDWNKLAQRLISYKIQFIIEPCTRFKDLAGEQQTMFFQDPLGYFLEFKSFKEDKQIFATQ